MQAHPLSSSAARNHLATSGSSQTASVTSCASDLNSRHTRSEPTCIAQTSGLAHDASNLLAALGLYSDLLARPGVLSPEHSHYATELRDLADRGSRLMRNLIPQIPAGAVASSTQPLAAATDPASIDPAQALYELEPVLVAIAAPHAAVSIATGRVPLVRFASQDFERILVNLVRNASQAIERSSTRETLGSGDIRIALFHHESDLTLTVEDNGPGMPVGAAAAFLSPAPLPPGASRGLGHRIVNELVTATGGTLSVRVRPGRGTCFVVTWPLHNAAISKLASPVSLASAGFSEVLPSC